MVVSCTNTDYEVTEFKSSDNTKKELEITTEALTKAIKSSVSDTLYQKTTHLLLVNKGDPYNLSNILCAVNNLNKRGILSDINIQASHLALKIYPKNEDELFYFESLTDVKLSSFPFEYTSIPLNSGVENYSVFPEICKYSVTYEDSERPNEKIELEMPVLYAVWPITKSLPQDYDYEIKYSIYIPDYNRITDPQLIRNTHLIEEESINLCNYYHDKEELPRSTRSFTGYLSAYDNILDENLPLINLKVRLQLGSNIQEVYTNSNGYFIVTGSTGSTLSIIYQHDKWKITNGNSSNAHSISLGTVTDTWTNGLSLSQNCLASWIHKGVNYCFTGDHPVTIPQNSPSIRISMTGTTEEWAGCFNSGLLMTPFIQISNNHIVGYHSIFSDICHEVGHYFHYLYRGGWLSFATMHRLFRESFADYFSWRLSHKYYSYYNDGIDDTSHGFLSWNYYFSRENQSWTPSSNSYYSPMFVDLVDNYNQSYTNPSYNKDPIFGKPDSLIESLVTDYDNWSEIKARLYYYVYTLFAPYELEDYFAPYDEYFN